MRLSDQKRIKDARTNGAEKILTRSIVVVFVGDVTDADDVVEYENYRRFFTAAKHFLMTSLKSKEVIEGTQVGGIDVLMTTTTSSRGRGPQ